MTCNTGFNLINSGKTRCEQTVHRNPHPLYVKVRLSSHTAAAARRNEKKTLIRVIHAGKHNKYDALQSGKLESKEKK